MRTPDDCVLVGDFGFGKALMIDTVRRGGHPAAKVREAGPSHDRHTTWQCSRITQPLLLESDPAVYRPRPKQSARVAVGHACARHHQV